MPKKGVGFTPSKDKPVKQHSFNDRAKDVMLADKNR